MKSFDTAGEALEWLIQEAALYQPARVNGTEAQSLWALSKLPCRFIVSASQTYEAFLIRPFKTTIHCHTCKTMLLIAKTTNYVIPEDLRSSIISLEVVYDELSDAIHMASSSVRVYTRSIKAIQDHFAAIHHHREANQRLRKTKKKMGRRAAKAKKA